MAHAALVSVNVLVADEDGHKVVPVQARHVGPGPAPTGHTRHVGPPLAHGPGRSKDATVRHVGPGKPPEDISQARYVGPEEHPASGMSAAAARRPIKGAKPPGTRSESQLKQLEDARDKKKEAKRAEKAAAEQVDVNATSAPESGTRPTKAKKSAEATAAPRSAPKKRARKTAEATTAPRSAPRAPAAPAAPADTGSGPETARSMPPSPLSDGTFLARLKQTLEAQNAAQSFPTFERIWKSGGAAATRAWMKEHQIADMVQAFHAWMHANKEQVKAMLAQAAEPAAAAAT